MALLVFARYSVIVCWESSDRNKLIIFAYINIFFIIISEIVGSIVCGEGKALLMN